MSKIEWTGDTWNIGIGCRRVSAGCENCYAEKVVHRGMSPQHQGLTVVGRKGIRWNGEVNVVPHRYDEPIRKKKPNTYFVNSLSDLFYDKFSNEWIAGVFGIMAACPHHTFQVLTKRPERAREWFKWVSSHHMPNVDCHVEASRLLGLSDLPGNDARALPFDPQVGWPLPNVWIGVSAENQDTANVRIPQLLDLPAATRFVSYEPALGPIVFFESWMLGAFDHCPLDGAKEDPETGEKFEIDPCAGCPGFGDECGAVRGPRLDWIIVGGESGPGARPFNVGWARHVVSSCHEYGVSCFVKQLGARPYETSDVFGEDAKGIAPGEDLLPRMGAPRPPQMMGWTRIRTVDGSWYQRHLNLNNAKGGDMDEWPKDLRVREMPKK